MTTPKHISEVVLSRWAGRFVMISLLAAGIVVMTWAETADAALTVLHEGDEAHMVEIPNEDAWAMSGHADAEAEAFAHWNEDDPPEIPTSCAKCHATPGHLDFLGADGSEAGVVDVPAPIGTTIECMACHNDVSEALDSVVMPSGVEITDLGSEARCMQCHQGRASKITVDGAIADANIVDVDAVSEDLGFINIHYYAAAATRFGTLTLGGYQYDGKSYDAKFAHVTGADECVDCHDPHSLQLKIDGCVACHPGVTSPDDLKDLRMVASTRDYDGDGDTTEGIYFELAELRDQLYTAIQTYATDVATPIVYDGHAYPYFFVDTNANGAVDEGEASYGNRYNAWTARMLKAAYNYQVSQKDPGAFAHNGKYIMQLLHDSIEDLDAGLVAGLTRNDVGHFAGSEEPWRHWDEDGGTVRGSCSKCHTPTGLPFFLAEGVSISQPAGNGLMCETCHDAVPGYTRRQVDEVEFPSGATLDTGDTDSNICINCHQGRESTVSVNAAIAGLEPDAVAASLRFLNPHYFAAGATLFGTEAKGAYEYEGKIYRGRLSHIGSRNTCTECHDAHTLEVNASSCTNPFCHGGNADATETHEIRRDPRDFDGDGWVTEGLSQEIETLRDVLFGAVLDYAANVVAAPIVYDSHAYPYFFNDNNANGEVDEGEASYGNRYQSWTPRLLRAAYNFQYAQKDPGAFAHNGHYIIQVLYDSLEDIGMQVSVDMTGMIRP
jgi:hypothetical protein